MRAFLPVCLMGVILAACSPGDLQAIRVQPSTATTALTAEPDKGNAALTAEQLRNMKVQLVAQDAHAAVQLKDGKYPSSQGPSSTDYAEIALLPQPIALGDLNGDGVGDAAVLLSENYGGTGVFVSVLAVLDVDGEPVQSGAFLIDDRPAVHSLRLDNQAIVLDADIHGPNDPGCCAAFHVSETYKLTSTGLQFRSLASETPDGTRRALAIENPPDGSEVRAGPVQIRGSFTVLPFENTLTYGVYDAAQNELTSGPITLAGSPGTRGVFEAPVDLGSIPAGTVVRLEIADISAADGSMLAMASIQLMIK